MQRLPLISGPLCRRQGSGSRRGRSGRNLRVQFRSAEQGRWHSPSLPRLLLPGILVRFNLRRLSLSEQIVLKPVGLPPREPRSLTEARPISIPGEIEVTGIRGNCMGLPHELFPVIHSPASLAVKSHPGSGQQGHQKEGEDETGRRRPHHAPAGPADAALAGALPGSYVHSRDFSGGPGQRKRFQKLQPALRGQLPLLVILPNQGLAQQSMKGLQALLEGPDLWLLSDHALQFFELRPRCLAQNEVHHTGLDPVLKVATVVVVAHVPYPFAPSTPARRRESARSFKV